MCMYVHVHVTVVGSLYDASVVVSSPLHLKCIQSTLSQPFNIPIESCTIVAQVFTWDTMMTYACNKQHVVYNHVVNMNDKAGSVSL